MKKMSECLPRLNKEVIKRDWVYIAALLIAFTALIWTLAAIDDYKQDFNRFHLKELERCGCVMDQKQFPDNFSLMLPIKHLGVYRDEDKNISVDAERSSVGD